jgi:hypothetical protein
MPGPYPFRYLRAYARYVGLNTSALNALLFEAQRRVAPGDTYAKAADGRWLTIQELAALAARGSIPAQDLLAKVREYAGETPDTPSLTQGETR